MTPPTTSTPAVNPPSADALKLASDATLTSDTVRDLPLGAFVERANESAYLSEYGEHVRRVFAELRAIGEGRVA